MTESSRVLSPKERWWPIAVVLGVSLLFGWIVLPQLDRRRQGLEGHPAPAVDLKAIYGPGTGQRQTLADFVGQPVILDFWASWCQPCREQAPIVDAVWRKNQSRGLVAVGIATGDTEPDAVAFLQGHAIGYPSWFDGDSRAASAFHVTELPTLVVIRRDGTVLAVRRRPVAEVELGELVEAAMR